MRNICGYVACLVENVNTWSSFFGQGIKNSRSVLAEDGNSFGDSVMLLVLQLI